MSLFTSQRAQSILSVMFSFVIATGLWYFVVGRDHIDTQIDLRVEYRGLPSGLTMLEGTITQLSVRLRGSEELLKGIRSRNLTYTVDLSSVQKGANPFLVQLSDLPEFKDRGIEIVEVSPSRFVLQIDSVVERSVSLEQRLLPPPKDFPFIIQHVSLSPANVIIKGAESRIGAINSLATVPHDPSKNAREGRQSEQIAINAPPHVEVTPPVTTISYDLSPKTVSVLRHLPIEIDSGISDNFEISPTEVDVRLKIPEKYLNDQDYAKDLHILVRNTANLLPGATENLPAVLVGLPLHASIESQLPSIKVTRKTIAGYNAFMLWNSSLPSSQQEKFSFLPQQQSDPSHIFDLPVLKFPFSKAQRSEGRNSLSSPENKMLSTPDLPTLKPLPASPRGIHPSIPSPSLGNSHTDGE